MDKEEKLYNNVYGATEQSCTITCSKCGKIDITYHADDTHGVVSSLIDDGWYATEKNTWCPKCNKKRIKK